MGTSVSSMWTKSLGRIGQRALVVAASAALLGGAVGATATPGAPAYALPGVSDLGESKFATQGAVDPGFRIQGSAIATPETPVFGPDIDITPVMIHRIRATRR